MPALPTCETAGSYNRIPNSLPLPIWFVILGSGGLKSGVEWVKMSTPPPPPPAGTPDPLLMGHTSHLRSIRKGSQAAASPGAVRDSLKHTNCLLPEMLPPSTHS